MRSVEKLVEEQVQRWQLMCAENKKEEDAISVITISREPGSGGRTVAQELAEKLGFDLHHQEVLHQMAESANFKFRFTWEPDQSPA